MPAGRPKGTNVKWNPKVQSRVLAELEAGATLREAAQNNGISDSLIIWNAAHDQEFSKRYARALSIRTERDFELLEDDLKVDPPMVSTKFGEYVDAGWVAWKRLQVDTRKWALSKRNPKKYGEKLQAELSGEIKTVIVPAAVKQPSARPENKPEFDKE